MRLSRTNMPLASSDSVISQLTYAVFLDNLAPHLRAENPDHKLFCHSQPQNPPQLSKSGDAHRYRRGSRARPGAPATRRIDRVRPADPSLPGGPVRGTGRAG